MIRFSSRDPSKARDETGTPRFVGEPSSESKLVQVKNTGSPELYNMCLIGRSEVPMTKRRAAGYTKRASRAAGSPRIKGEPGVLGCGRTLLSGQGPAPLEKNQPFEPLSESA